jgi:hypothetical protein
VFVIIIDRDELNKDIFWKITIDDKAMINNLSKEKCLIGDLLL